MVASNSDSVVAGGSDSSRYSPTSFFRKTHLRRSRSGTWCSRNCGECHACAETRAGTFEGDGALRGTSGWGLRGPSDWLTRVVMWEPVYRVSRLSLAQMSVLSQSFLRRFAQAQ